MKTWTHLLLILWLTTGTALSAQPTFENPIVLNEVNGLPSNRIMDVAQDRFGFTWIATGQGLCRFDGKETKVYDFIPNDTSRLYTRIVYDIHIDQEDRLWLATRLGLHVYDPRTDSFRSYLPSADDRYSLPFEWLQNVTRDRDNTIWVTLAHRGMARYLPATDGFEQFLPSTYFPRTADINWGRIDHVILLRQDVREDHLYWLATQAGLVRWDRAADCMELFVNKDFSYNEDLSIAPYCMYQYPDGRILIGQWSYGLILFDPRTETLRHVRTVTDARGNGYQLATITAILPKSERELWVVDASHNRLYLLDMDRLLVLEQWSGRKRDDEYRVCMIDTLSHSYWAGYDKGLYIYHPLAQHIHHWKLELAADDRRTYDGSGVIADRDGWYWASFYAADGLYHIHPTTGRYRLLPLPEGTDVFSITDLLKTSNGRVLACDEQLIYQLSADRQRLEIFPHQPNWKVERPSISDLFEDRLGNLWVATLSDGLYKWQADRKAWRHYLNELNTAGDPQHHIWLWGMTEDEYGKIWFRASTGYSVYYPEGDSLRNFPFRRGRADQFINVADLVGDHRGRMWMVGPEDGMGYVDVRHPERGIIRRFGEADGLELSTIRRITRDRQNNLWLLGNKELARLRPADMRFDYFDQRYGIPGYDAALFISALSGAELETMNDGRVALLYRRGLAVFDPEQLQRDQSFPKPYLRAFKVFDEELELDSALWFKKQIRLSHRRNFFSFEFSAINYALPEQTIFQYQLEGVDEGWVQAGKRRYTAYTNIPGGEYTFRLMAANSEGAWSPEVYTLQLIIATPWWRTGWFRLAVLLGFAGAIYGLYRYRLRQVRRQQSVRADYEKKLARIEMNALRAQMNPHFIFNSLNSIDSFIIKNETHKASEYLNDFARLIRLILQNSRANVVNLEEELEALDLYLKMEKLRFRDKFDYEIIVADSVLTETTSVPPMLIQPYVENAIWHGLMHKQNGETGKVTVSLWQDEYKLHCRVEDNGIGRAAALAIKAGKPDRGKKSVGMQITKDRIDLINNLYQSNTTVHITDLTDEEGRARGTRVEIIIPT